MTPTHRFARFYDRPPAPFQSDFARTASDLAYDLVEAEDEIKRLRLELKADADFHWKRVKQLLGACVVCGLVWFTVGKYL